MHRKGPHGCFDLVQPLHSGYSGASKGFLVTVTGSCLAAVWLLEGRMRDTGDDLSHSPLIWHWFLQNLWAPHILELLGESGRSFKPCLKRLQCKRVACISPALPQNWEKEELKGCWAQMGMFGSFISACLPRCRMNFKGIKPVLARRTARWFWTN